MRTGPRMTIAIIVGVAVHYSVFWVPFSLMPLGDQCWIATIVSLACGIMAGRFVWRRTADVDQGVVSLMLSGPIIFAPGANQGPLLGIFITGPLGFLVGGAGGLVYGLSRRKAF